MLPGMIKSQERNPRELHVPQRPALGRRLVCRGLVIIVAFIGGCGLVELFELFDRITPDVTCEGVCPPPNPGLVTNTIDFEKSVWFDEPRVGPASYGYRSLCLADTQALPGPEIVLRGVGGFALVAYENGESTETQFFPDQDLAYLDPGRAETDCFQEMPALAAVRFQADQANLRVEFANSARVECCAFGFGSADYEVIRTIIRVFEPSASGDSESLVYEEVLENGDGAGSFVVIPGAVVDTEVLLVADDARILAYQPRSR